MFEDSLFDCGASFSLQQRSLQQRRGWTALVSFAAQALLVGVGIILPIVLSVPTLPSTRIIEMPILPHSSESEMAAQRQSQPHGNVNPEQLHLPRNIPKTAIPIIGPATFPDVGSAGPRTSNELDGRGGGDQISTLFGSGPAVIPVLPKPTAKRWKVSGGVAQGLLIQGVKPVYPRLAQVMGVQGDVVLQAVIGKDGRIENLHAVSGNPLLVKAALDAVQQWRYRPYRLNGEPVEVETQITVRFNMS
ncbi:MAG: energy transducer TonB [Terriglobales bacterium]